MGGGHGRTSSSMVGPGGARRKGKRGGRERERGRGTAAGRKKGGRDAMGGAARGTRSQRGCSVHACMRKQAGKRT
jgi:hypothetical protein